MNSSAASLEGPARITTRRRDNHGAARQVAQGQGEPSGALRMLRIRSVVDITGLSRSAIYRAISSSGFPRPVKLGPAKNRSSIVGWPAHEVDAWLRKMVRESRQLDEQAARGAERT